MATVNSTTANRNHVSCTRRRRLRSARFFALMPVPVSGIVTLTGASSWSTSVIGGRTIEAACPDALDDRGRQQIVERTPVGEAGPQVGARDLEPRRHEALPRPSLRRFPLLRSRAIDDDDGCELPNLVSSLPCR